MTIAANLVEAANLSYLNIYTPWQLGVPLITKLLTFSSNVAAQFSDTRPNDRPVGNWIIPFQAFAVFMQTAPIRVPTNLNTAVQFVYRICYATNQLNVQGLISGAQATAVLTSYNALFG